MPRSPYPGMDPYIERDEWEDFHTRLMTTIGDRISPAIRPGYIARVERRVYIDDPDISPDPSFRQADVAVVESESWGVNEPTAAVATAPAVSCTVPLPTERRESFLTVRHTRDRSRIVTIIEVLSPSNKRAGSEGIRQYLRKRRDVLQSDAHLVEIDLLLGGTRPPIDDRPPGDYFVMTGRRGRRPQVDVVAWSLMDRLPTIAVPLTAPDPDVPLDLQAAFASVYENAGYDLSIKYDGAYPEPA